MSWERAEVHENEPPDWEEELNATINELHQEPDGLLVSWENSWEWLQSGEDYPRSCHEQEEAEIYYSDNEESEIYYSDAEAVLGAAGGDDSDDKPDDPGPQVRRSRKNVGSNTTNVGVPGTTLGFPQEHRRTLLPVHHLQTDNQLATTLR